MTVREVLQVLRIGKTKLHAEVKAGKLTKVMNGRRALFEEAEILRYIASLPRSSAPPAEGVHTKPTRPSARQTRGSLPSAGQTRGQ
jgi:excisionase family DNA binding protein